MQIQQVRRPEYDADGADGKHTDHYISSSSPPRGGGGGMKTLVAPVCFALCTGQLHDLPFAKIPIENALEY